MRPKTRRFVLLAILVLSPAAYLAAMYLADRIPNPYAALTINREQAIQAAVEFAGTRQIDTREWSADVTSTKNTDISILLRQRRLPVVEQLTAAVPLIVYLTAPDRKRNLKVDLSPGGRVLAFTESRPETRPQPIDEDAARKIAADFLAERRRGLTGVEIDDSKVRTKEKQGQDRTFTWPATLAGTSQVTANITVEVYGSRVIAQTASVKIDPAFYKSLRPAHGLFSGVQFTAGLLIAVLGVFAIVRYVRRSGEKEVSHRRTALVALLFAISGAVEILGSPLVNININGEPATGSVLVIALASGIIVFAVMGVFFGIAYGAGEGDLRQVYSGKLTSLDAFMSGKIFSTNAARSILTGGGIAGWVLLMECAVLLAARAVPPINYQSTLSSAVMKYPLMGQVPDTLLDAVAVTAFGLLLPIALLRPRVRRAALFYPLLAICAAAAASLWLADGSQWRNYLITLTAAAAAGCAAFFVGDVLAAISGLVALDFVSNLIHRSRVAPEWHYISTWAVPVGIAFLLLELYFAKWGKSYEEREVRPMYARLLAEHLAMQAEIGAARLAQLRLLPDAPPEIYGLSIAAACTPAKEVGGDFFDFYSLDDHRLGVFLAEGGNRALGSAMTIALAKGFLLYTTRLDLSPVEVLRRLHETLETVLRGENAPMSVLYAVIDARARTLVYARTGESPCVTIGGMHTTEAVSEVQAGSAPIRFGSAALPDDGALIFYTDGLPAQLIRHGQADPTAFLAKATAGAEGKSAAVLQSEILQMAVKSKQLPPDDVTAVVVRYEKTADRTMEVVA